MGEKIMSLKRPAGWVSFFLLFGLLAWYSQGALGDVREDMLIRTWNLTFHRLSGECVYWITLRLTAWILLYLRLLRLEGGFSLYLFLRQRNYGRIFARIYAECVGMDLCYYGIGTLVMAVFHSVTVSGADMGILLRQSGLLRILAEECLESFSLCLGAFTVHCVSGKAEAGFLAVLAGRILLNFATGGLRPGLPVQITVNLAMAAVAFFVSLHDFTERFAEFR